VWDYIGNSGPVTAGQVVINGEADTTTSGVITLAYINNQLWQEVCERGERQRVGRREKRGRGGGGRD
jgi:hypothetical protein